MFEDNYTSPLDKHLLGNRNLKFVNGVVISVNVDVVIVNGYGEPIMLVDTEGVVYNWSTIVEVKENVWTKP